MYSMSIERDDLFGVLSHFAVTRPVILQRESLFYGDYAILLWASASGSLWTKYLKFLKRLYIVSYLLFLLIMIYANHALHMCNVLHILFMTYLLLGALWLKILYHHESCLYKNVKFRAFRLLPGIKPNLFSLQPFSFYILNPLNLSA